MSKTHTDIWKEPTSMSKEPYTFLEEPYYTNRALSQNWHDGVKFYRVQRSAYFFSLVFTLTY